MMVNSLVLALALAGQHPAHHAAMGGGGHSGGHVAGAAVGHPGGHAGATMEHQIMFDAFQHQQQMQHEQQERRAYHEAMVKQDLPNLQSHFVERKFDRRHWDELRHQHHRLGVEAFWRLARKHRDVDKLLAALREEKAHLKYDSTGGRLARVKARHEMEDMLSEGRFNAYLKERRFDRKYWESLRRYYERLGGDAFWRIAHEHKEFDQLRMALSSELRRELLEGLGEETAAAPHEGPGPIRTGLIEIAPADDTHGMTTGGPSSPR